MKKQSFKNIVCLAIGLAFMTICSGCASAPEPASSPTGTQALAAQPGGTTQQRPGEAVETYYTHLVKWPGESLSIIAGWYTGDVQNWKALAEANPDINPNRIHEGMKLRIPESMMSTKAAMTKEHVDSYYPKQKRPSTKSSSSGAGKDEDPVLFGPKQYPVK
jgi:hypothetical protein